MFKLDQYGGEDAYQCKMIQACKENKDTIVNPIYRFTEQDVWDYVTKYEVPMNPLYSQGWRRVGCIGCPLASHKDMKWEFEQYPQYYKNYLKAFDRMMKKKKAEGKKFLRWDLQTGEEVMRWWLGENPMQVRIEDILEDNENELSESLHRGGRDNA